MEKIELDSAVLHDKTVILVVDDEKLIRLTVGAKLKKEGYVPVAVASVEEAVHVLKNHIRLFSAIISDIMMGDMDGFDFRDIVRGMDKSMPFFFMTALDPEEGSGFLKRIVSDPISYYLPKSVDTEVLLKRVKQVVASRRVEDFIERQVEENRRSLHLAAHIQRSMLPERASMDGRSFYSAWWQPKEIVSGDIYEVMPAGKDARLYILGDIQGHGTGAALAMTAVQSFLKNLMHVAEVDPNFGPVSVANLLHRFFRDNLADVSYMTALICLHDFARGEVRWLSCGAPDLVVSDIDRSTETRADSMRTGGLPVGLVEDIVYTEADMVVDRLSPTSVCIAFTDGLYDISQDADGFKRISQETLAKVRREFLDDVHGNGFVMVGSDKYMTVFRELGYDKLQDDVTILVFGPRVFKPGVFEAAIPLTPADLDKTSQEMGEWCRAQGWPDEDVCRLQLVLEEKVMNVHYHGFAAADRLHEVVFVRLCRRRDGAFDLTVWDFGTPEPSLAVAAGDASTAFELANRAMSGRGRGRLMVRELCSGIERKRFGTLNETVYHVKAGDGQQA